MRAAVIQVIADAAVSVLVIVGLILARTFGWLWMDPIAGIIGACAIASWSFGLIRDTGAILLDMIPIVAVATESDGDAGFYRAQLAEAPALLHVTIEVNRIAA
ncbi:MAG: cation transporter [Sphingomonas sp.]